MDFDDFFSSSSSSNTIPPVSNGAVGTNTSFSFDALDDLLGGPPPTSSPTVSFTTAPTSSSLSSSLQFNSNGFDDEDEFGDFQEGSEDVPSKNSSNNIHNMSSSSNNKAASMFLLDNHNSLQQQKQQHVSNNNNNNSNNFDDILSSFSDNNNIGKPSLSFSNDTKATTTDDMFFVDTGSSTIVTSQPPTANTSKIEEEEEEFGDFETAQFDEMEDNTTVNHAISATTSTPATPSTNEVANTKASNEVEEEFGDFEAQFEEEEIEERSESQSRSMRQEKPPANKKSATIDILSLFGSSDTPATTATVSPTNLNHDQNDNTMQIGDDFLDGFTSFSTPPSNPVVMEPSSTTTTTTSPIHSQSLNVEADTQPIEFETSFDDEEFGDFAGGSEETKSEQHIPQEKSELPTKQQQQEQLQPVEFEASFDDEEFGDFAGGEPDEVKINNSSTVQMTSMVEQQTPNPLFHEIEQEEKNEPTGTSESDIFNKLVYNQRFSDAETYLKSPKDGSLVWWNRERLDIFTSSVLREMLSILTPEHCDQFINEFVPCKFTTDKLNYETRRLQFQATNWERSCTRALDAILEKNCVVARLLLQGLRELETCTRFLETVTYEQQKNGEDDILFVQHLLKNEKVKVFMKACVQVYTMTKICLSELSRSYHDFSSSYSRVIIQRRLDLFANMWHNTRQGNYVTDLIPELTVQPYVETNSTSKKCCLSGRDLSNDNNSRVETSKIGLVYSPYKKFYSYRVKPLL